MNWLEKFQDQEYENSLALALAIESGRYPRLLSRPDLRGSFTSRSAWTILYACNHKSRVWWARCWEDVLRLEFPVRYQVDNKGPLHFVTLSDDAHTTSDQPQKIKLRRRRRYVSEQLQGFSFIGMI